MHLASMSLNCRRSSGEKLASALFDENGKSKDGHVVFDGSPR